MKLLRNLKDKENKVGLLAWCNGSQAKLANQHERQLFPSQNK